MRKLRYSKRSYTIFSPPDKKNGKLRSAGILIKTPVIDGEIAAPTDLAIAVTPEAADLSSGSTTAMV